MHYLSDTRTSLVIVDIRAWGMGVMVCWKKLPALGEDVDWVKLALEKFVSQCGMPPSENGKALWDSMRNVIDMVQQQRVSLADRVVTEFAAGLGSKIDAVGQFLGKVDITTIKNLLTSQRTWLRRQLT